MSVSAFADIKNNNLVELWLVSAFNDIKKAWPMNDYVKKNLYSEVRLKVRMSHKCYMW
jgi:hypothetical protein